MVSMKAMHSAMLDFCIAMYEHYPVKMSLETAINAFLTRPGIGMTFVSGTLIILEERRAKGAQL